jgi:hypothetical protein
MQEKACLFNEVYGMANLVLIPCLKIECSSFIMLMNDYPTVMQVQILFLQAIYNSQTQS